VSLVKNLPLFYKKIRTKFEYFGYQESGEDMFSYTVN